MIRLRFRQLIRVVLLGLAIGLPVSACADIISESEADSSSGDSTSEASDSDATSGDSSADTSSSDSESSDSSSSDSTSDSPSDSANSDDSSSEAVESVANPEHAAHLLHAAFGGSSRHRHSGMHSGHFDPSSGYTSFPVTDDSMGNMPDCVAVPTPEPGSLALWTFAVAGVVGYRWRSRQQPAVD